MNDLIGSWRADAGAQGLFSYIDAPQLGTSPDKPVASKCYANLLYLGRFGVLRGDPRGAGVGFLPAATPEPHLVLDVHCG